MNPLRSLARTALAASLGLTLAAGGILALAHAEPPRAGYAPDPAGVASRKQWVFELRHHRGTTSILRVGSVSVAQPIATTRVLGRFALEFYVGRELLDRLRFNVPLTGDAPEKDRRRPFRRPSFDESVTTQLRLQMADSPRASYVKLVDRLTGDEQRFLWPPEPDGRLVPIGGPAGEPEVVPAAGGRTASGDAGGARGSDGADGGGATRVEEGGVSRATRP